MSKIKIIALSIMSDYQTRYADLMNAGKRRQAAKLKEYYDGAQPSDFIIEGPSNTQDGLMTCVINRTKGFARLDAKLPVLDTDTFWANSGLVKVLDKPSSWYLKEEDIEEPIFVQLEWMEDKPIVCVGKTGMEGEESNPLLSTFDVETVNFAEGKGLVIQTVDIEDPALSEVISFSCYNFENFIHLIEVDPEDIKTLVIEEHRFQNTKDGGLYIPEVKGGLTSWVLDGLSVYVEGPEGLSPPKVDPAKFVCEFKPTNEAFPKVTVESFKEIVNDPRYTKITGTRAYPIVSIEDKLTLEYDRYEYDVTVSHPDVSDGEKYNGRLTLNLITNPSRLTFYRDTNSGAEELKGTLTDHFSDKIDGSLFSSMIVIESGVHVDLNALHLADKRLDGPNTITYTIKEGKADQHVLGFIGNRTVMMVDAPAGAGASSDEIEIRKLS